MSRSGHQLAHALRTIQDGSALMRMQAKVWHRCLVAEVLAEFGGRIGLGQRCGILGDPLGHGLGVLGVEFTQGVGSQVGMVVGVHGVCECSESSSVSRARSFLRPTCMRKPTLPMLRPVIRAMSL